MTESNSFHHGDLKQALFNAGLSLLDQSGISGVTMRAVARSAGVSHSAPVNHYKDRPALLTAIAQAQFKTILEQIETDLLKAPSELKNRIEVFANTIIDFGLKYPHRYQLLWRGDLIDHENPDLLVVMDSIYDKLCDEIERGMPGAHVDKDTVAIALWSMLHGYVDMRLSGMFLPANDKVSDKPRRYAIMDLFLTLMK